MDTTLLRAALALIGLALAQALWGCAPHASAADASRLAETPAPRRVATVPDYIGDEYRQAEDALTSRPDEPIVVAF